MHADLFTQELDLVACTSADLWALAREYHERCEAFDQTVCTGGLNKYGEAMPANGRELGLINVNARRVLAEVMLHATAAGFSFEDLMRAIRKAA